MVLWMGSDATAVEQVKSELLIKAFRGEIDRETDQSVWYSCRFLYGCKLPGGS